MPTSPPNAPSPVDASCLLIGDPRATRPAAAILSAHAIGCTRVRSPEHPTTLTGPVSPAIVVLFGAGAGRELARAIRSLTARFPDSAVIVAGAGLERWEIRSALAAGASGVLADDGNLASTLPCTIRAVLAGQTCVPREHGRQLMPPALSTREKQILGLVVMGYMNCQIAERLFLAESTVKSHLSSAFGKLGVRSRNEAAHLILDPDRGLGTGILAVGGEPVRASPVPAT